MATTVNRSVLLTLVAALLAAAACHRAAPAARVYDTPQHAADALIATIKAGDVNDLIAIFGPEGKELVESADVADARQNREVFAAAARERWHLEDGPNGAKTLVVGNEDWPFPVPIVHDAEGWHFDTAAGKEEVIARRVGRNELAVIQACRTYVAAQHLYAASGHDGQPAGAFAAAFKSDPGRQNGLYWPAGRREKRSPLGDLVASAAQEGRPIDTKSPQSAPFHGYYFRILTAQGPAAPGGARDYMAGGRMTGGFALVAWPAAYDSSGVMTFIVGSDGAVREKDLGSGTDANARSMPRFDPDDSWAVVPPGSPD
jgi:hypothetical protein